MILRGFFVEHDARRGKRNPAPVADEQRPADLFFQTPDALAQRRLGNVETRCRPAEMQLFGEHGERGQFLGFECHKLKLSQASKHFIGRISRLGHLL